MNKIVITFVASFLIWIMFAGILFLWVIDGRIKKEQALHAAFTSVLAWTIAKMLKSLIPTTRPYIERGLDPLTLTNPLDSAFPSSHTAIAFGIAVSIWLHNKKLGTLYLVAAVLIGLARVVGNVHYPIDIVGGAIVGSIVGFVVDRVHLYKLITQRKG